MPLITIGTVTVNTGGGRLRVRTEPNEDAEIVGYISEGTAQSILGFSDDGQWVRIIADEVTAADDMPVGAVGWVSMEFVSIRLGPRR
jgi:hypothetical protein